MANPDLIIGTQHGDDCTCQKLEPVEVSFTPVVVDRHCPDRTEAQALDETPGSDEIHGRVIITWPRPNAGLYATPGAPLVSIGICVHDADTGEQLNDGTSLSISLGSPGNWTSQPIIAEITRVTGADGEPLGSRSVEMVDDEVPIGWFRYEVTEMRIAEA